MAGVYISCKPREVLVDEQIDTRVEGLLQGACVTIQAVIREGHDTFSACGWYTADDHGVVDVTKQSSVGGSFTGTEPMGLIWSLESAPGQTKSVRLRKADITSPQVVTFYVYSGYFDNKELYEHVEYPMAYVEANRWYLSKGVQRHQIKQGKIRGTLFIPVGNGPFPSIIDLFGGAGGLAEYRAALLASRGFLTLALAFFSYQDLPETPSKVSIKYFMEAATFLNSHPYTQKGGIGVIGTSQGGEVANLMSLYCPDVKAVVTISGLPIYLEPGITDIQQPLLSCRDIFSKMMYDGNAVIVKEAYFDFEKEDCIKVLVQADIEQSLYPKQFSLRIDQQPETNIWESNAKFLNICGTDDQNVHPRLQYLQYKAFPEDKKKNIELVAYEGAGHLIEPPHSPLCKASYIKYFGCNLAWGGHWRPHARAQEDSWKRILKFFTKHLGFSNVLLSRL